MGTRKFTIEISDESAAVIERLKLDDATMEEVIPQLLDLGILEALTSQVNPMSKLLDTIMSRRGNSNPIAEMMTNLFGGNNGDKPSMSEPDPSAVFKMMRLDKDGQPVEMDMNDLPPEVAEHLKDMTASITKGISEGKSIEEIMESVGATKCVHLDDIPTEMKETASKTNTGNLIHFPDTSKLS